jgi:hypothetical protein
MASDFSVPVPNLCFRFLEIYGYKDLDSEEKVTAFSKREVETGQKATEFEITKVRLLQLIFTNMYVHILKGSKGDQYIEDYSRKSS